MSKKDVKPSEVNPDLMDVIKNLPGADERGESNPTEKSIKETVDDTDVIDYGEDEDTTVDSDKSGPAEDSMSDEVSAKDNESDDEEMVELFISNLESSDTKISISINLKTFEIPVGEPVMVPKYVRDYWRTLSKQKANFNNKANSMVYDN